MCRVAIIGSGISGLTAAWMLSRAGWSVVLIDRQPVTGIDSAAVELNDDYGSSRIDVPVRMFQPTLWPRLWSLYAEAGVAVVPVNAAQSCTVSGSRGALRFSAPGKPDLQTRLFSRLGHAVARDLRRLIRRNNELSPTKPEPRPTLAEYLKSCGCSPLLMQRFLYPTVGTTVFTCSREALENCPAKIVLAALKSLKDGEALCRARFGTHDVAVRLAARGANRINGSAAVSINESVDGVTIHLENGQSVTADHVVVATQANHARHLLAPDRELCLLLDEFRYEPVQVVVHRDRGLMPHGRRNWRTFNMISRGELDAACCSIWLNRFYEEWPSGREPVFQTIWAGPRDRFAVDPALVLAERELQRPVVSAASQAAIESIRRLQQQRGGRIWYCGSWAAAGVPLLESGVESAQWVAGKIGPCPTPAGLPQASR